MQGFHPIFRSHVGMDKECAYDVIRCTDESFGLAVLW